VERWDTTNETAKCRPEEGKSPVSGIVKPSIPETHLSSSKEVSPSLVVSDGLGVPDVGTLKVVRQVSRYDIVGMQEAIVDTGSDVSLLNNNVVQKKNLKREKHLSYPRSVSLGE
jgi:hypothetical protein